MLPKLMSGWSAGLVIACFVFTAPAQEVPAVVPGEVPVPAAIRVPGSTNVSGWLADLIKLARAGIEENVLLAFVDSAGTFNADADNIIYLRDLGVSNEVIGSMIRHDLDVALGAREVVTYATPSTTSTPEVDTLLSYLRKSRVATSAPAPTNSTKMPGGIGSSAAPAAAQSSAGATIVVPEPDFHDQGSIVMDSGSPDVFAELGAARAAAEEAFEHEVLARRFELENVRTSTAVRAAIASGRYPIREPYAVRLTNSVVIIPGAGRLPNLLIIEVAR